MAHDSDEATSTLRAQEQADSRPSVSTRRGSDVLEATELSRIRTQYSRATDSYRAASGSTSQATPTGPRKLKSVISKFWNNQISIIVAHEASRDHLGTCAIQSLSYVRPLALLHIDRDKAS